jgi:hypothetical protein
MVSPYDLEESTLISAEVHRNFSAPILRCWIVQFMHITCCCPILSRRTAKSFCMET